MHCLELDTGKKVWDRDLAADYQAPKGYFGLPARRSWRAIASSSMSAARTPALLPWTRTRARRSGKQPKTPPAIPRPWPPRSTACGTSFSSPAKGSSRSTRPTARCVSTSAGGPGLPPRSTPPCRWSSMICCSSPPCYGVGAVVHRVRKDGIDEIWKGDNILSQPLQLARSSGRLPVWHRGPAGRRGRRAAMRRTEDRQGPLVEEALRLRVADLRGRPPGRPGRERRPGAGRSDAGRAIAKRPGPPCWIRSAGPKSPWRTAGSMPATANDWPAGT